MEKYGLIGYPLRHSFSIGYFNEKFKSEGINAEYVNFEIPSINNFMEVIEENPNLCGLNVTIPYKEQVIPFLDELDRDTAKIGAVNVIKIIRQPKGKVKLVGYNSDIIGFTQSIQPLLQPHHKKALILGTGGASKAVYHGLKNLGIESIFVSRTHKADDMLTYEELTPEIMAEYTVIVNCTPVGMFPKVDFCPNIPYELLTPNHLLYDLLYNPNVTLFMKKGEAQGAVVKNGLEMLLLQAFAAWEIWHKLGLKEVFMRRKVVYSIIIIMLALTGCTIGGSFYMLNFSLTPNGKILSKDADSYPFMYKNYPFLRPWVDSLKQVDALKDTFIINPHGIQLHAYYVAAPQPTSKTAVIVHGYTDNAIRMFMIGYLYNRDLGYNILLPDLQHQGESEGPAIQMGWKDRLDVLQWMNIANEIFGDSTQMVVHGISMGGATTMMVSGEEQKPFVKCFVEDCGYTSVWDEFSHELKTSFHLPPFPLMYTTSWLCEKKYGWNFKEASSLKQVAKSQLPMLFIHGDKDTYVPTWMVYPLYEAKPEPKELWIVPGAAHAVSYQENKQEYTDRVRAFVGRYIH